MRIRLLLIAVLSLFTGRAFSQVTCYAITPATSGTGAGSSWTNAHGGIPALVRGTRYYFADGSYAGFTFSNAASGTTTIEFRKAQSYDFGRIADGCSNDISAGFNAGTMGAGQASFSRTVNINGPYFTFNGNGQQSVAGCGGAPASTITGVPPTITDCGFVVDDTSCSANCAKAISYSTGPFTFEYVELRGNSTPSANEDNFAQGSGSNASTWQHIYGHNTGAVYFQYGCNTRTVDHSYFWGTEVQGPTADGTHGQYSYCGNTDSNGVESNNIYRDITGTSVWTFAFPDNTHTGWVFYNNVIFNSTTFTGGSLTLGWISDGLIACINTGSNCNNFTFSQNTIINAGDSSGINNENTGSYTVQNNLWYNIAHGSVSFSGGTGGTFTQDHNSFIASGSSCPSGTGNVCANAGPNPFVSWTTYTSAGFNLASDNADWNNRVSLSAPFTADANGVTFTTDRGAYQFVSGTASFNGSPAVIPANHSHNITVTLTGVSTTWNGSTAFSISGVTGATLTGHSNISATSETLTITTGTGTGTLTITDTTDSISTTISVSTATLAIAPSAGNISTTPTLTLTGSNTLWTTETAAGLFTVTGGTGSSIATPTVTSNTSATAVLTTGSATGNETITDTSTTATTVFTVAIPTAPTVTTGTAFNETASGASISANSYVCTGSCFGVTSVGTCYALTANPTTPCTSDGTGSPFSSAITGLASSTTYHYRAFSANAAGTGYGADQTFTTQPPGLTFLQYLPSGSCSTAVTETGSSATWTAPCTPFAVGDALVMFAQCHPTSGTITGITLTAPGWTINQIVPPATTGLNSWGAIFGTIVPNTSATTFTATFTGAANCSNFAVFLSGEFAGNDPTGGSTTFNATGLASGSGSTCNQTAANITPPLNNEGVWAACLLGTATTATAPWTIGAADGTGDTSEYQILVGGAAVAQTPAFNGSSGNYIVEGVAIAPAPTVSCPPPYYCAYTGTDIVQPAATPPNLGTYTNNGAIVFDSSYLSHTLPTPYQQSRIARCTDQNFTPSGGLSGFSAGLGGAGSGIEWNTNSTLIHIVGNSGPSTVALFNPSTMVCSPAITKDKDLTNPGSPTTLGNFGLGEFSQSVNNLYWLDGIIGTEVTNANAITPITIDPTTGNYSIGSTAADFTFGLPVGSNVAEWQSNHSYAKGVYVKHTLTGGDVKTWAATTAFSQGDLIYPGAPNCGFMVQTAGTTSGTQPTWPLVGGICGGNPTVVTDGTVKWRSLVSSPPAFIYQLTSASGTSGGSTPAFVPVATGHPDLFTTVTDGSLTWTNAGVNVIAPNGLWSTIARVSPDGTRFSESFSTNTYGAAPGSLVTTGSGINYANAIGDQGTGLTALVYDSNVNIYHLMNTLTLIQTDWVCTGGTGYNCSGGTFVQTPLGVATGAACPFLLHTSAPTAAGDYISLGVSGAFIGNSCPASSPQIWRPLQAFNATTQVTPQFTPLTHEAYGFSHVAGLGQNALNYGFQNGAYSNIFNLASPNSMPPTSWQAFPCDTVVPPVWTRGDTNQPCQIQIDEHLSWAFNPAKTDVTPACGTFYEVNAATANSSNPGAAYEGEVVCFSTVPTALSVGSAELGTQWRFAHTWNYQTNSNFNIWFNIGQLSQDGRYYAHGTDWQGQFGSTTGSAPVLPVTNSSVQCLGGFPWRASFTYSLGAVINPIPSLNGGGSPFDAYQAVAVTTGISGSTPPNWASTDGTIGAQFTDNGVTWQDLGAGNCRGDVVITELTPTVANAPPNTPTCSPGSGIYGSTQTISCSDTSPGAVMCYAVAPTVPVTDGASSCIVGTHYISSFTVAVTEQINIIAGGTGYSDSALQSYSYTIGSSSPPVGQPGRPAIDILLNP